MGRSHSNIVAPCEGSDQIEAGWFASVQAYGLPVVVTDRSEQPQRESSACLRGIMPHSENRAHKRAAASRVSTAALIARSRRLQRQPLAC